MSPAEAAAVWLEQKPIAKAAAARVADAEKVLKEHFRKSKRSTLKGVTYSVASFTALDAGLARELLGDRAAEAEVVRTRETLSAV